MCCTQCIEMSRITTGSFFGAVGISGALDQHFDVPESMAFVKAIRALAVDATKMRIFETVAP